MLNVKACCMLRNPFESLKSFYLGVRNFLVTVTIEVASDEVTARKEKVYLNKLNLAMVQVRSGYYKASAALDFCQYRSLSKNGRTTGLRSFQS